jgi:hypothetical protein
MHVLTEIVWIREAVPAEGHTEIVYLMHMDYKLE